MAIPTTLSSASTLTGVEEKKTKANKNDRYFNLINFMIFI